MGDNENRYLIHNYLKAQLREERIHRGAGLGRHTRVFGDGEIEAPVRFINYTILLPGSSIGLHRHGNDNEFYIVLDGNGIYVQEEQEIPVTAGDIIMNPPYGTHAIKNTGDMDMPLLVFEVAIPSDADHIPGEADLNLEQEE